MAVRTRKYPLEEFARRGKEIYNRIVRPILTQADDNKLVAIDIDSEAYEIDADDMTACKRLLDRFPEAQIWVERIGHAGADRLGLRLLREINTFLP